MLTPRGWGLVAAGVACLVAGRLVGIPHLDIVGLAALLAVAAAAGLNRRHLHLEVTRPPTLPVTAHGDAISVRLRLRNGGRIPLGPVDLADATAEGLHTGARAQLGGLAPGAGVPLSYQAVGRVRGRHAFGPLSVTVTDPLTIARRTLVVDGRSEVIVLPRIVALPDVIRPVSGRVPGDRGAGLPQPMGDDVGSIREYHVGDDLRRIHWPATAHRGNLMVRQTESRRRERAVILLDRTPRDGFELRVEITASIGTALAARGSEVQVVDDPRDLQPGALPWEVQLERLATIEAQPSDLTSLTAMLAGGAVGSGTLVVVAPAHDRLPVLLQRLGRSFDRRIGIVTVPRRSGIGIDRTLLAVRALAWQVTAINDLDRLPESWQRLALARSA